MTYTVKYGETFGDAVLNSTGNRTNWSAILDANNFTDWTPTLTAGELLIVPDGLAINIDAADQLAKYPACNYSVSNVYALIAAVFAVIATAGEATAPKAAIVVKDTNTYYIVSYGETITDVVLNATGNKDNWDMVLNANNFGEWVPLLTVGQILVIPATVTNDPNVQRQLNTYPANNASVSDVYNKIDVIIGGLNQSDWILRSGFWDDTGYWRDNAYWIDSL